MDDMGHGFRYLSDVSELYGPLMNFLDENLGLKR